MGHNPIPRVPLPARRSVEDVALDALREDYAHDRIDIATLEEKTAQVLAGKVPVITQWVQSYGAVPFEAVGALQFPRPTMQETRE